MGRNKNLFFFCLICFLLVLADPSFSAVSYKQLTLPSDITGKMLYGIDVIDSSNIWVVGTQGAVAKSSDGGQTWTTNAMTGVATLANHTFRAVQFIDANTGFVAGKNYASDRGVVYKTIDGGVNWTVSGFVANSEFFDVKFRNSTGFLATQKGLYTSTDTGGTWSQVANISLIRNCRSISWPLSSYLWVTGTNGFIVRSVDGGSNWSGAAVSPTFTGIGNSVFALGPNYVWILSNSTEDVSNGTRAILKSLDAGASWTETTGTSSAAKYKDIKITLSRSGGDIEINGAFICGRNTSDQANILAYDGSSWTEGYASAETGSILNAMDTSDNDNVWFAGGSSTGGLVIKRVSDPVINDIAQKNRPSQSSLPVGFTGDITIKGGKFLPTPAVSVSGSGVTINSTTLDNPTQTRVNVTVASGASTGTRDFTVQNWDGGIVTSDATNQITLSPLPTVTLITPEVWVQGFTANIGSDQVTIEGTGFQADISKDDISFGSGVSVLRVQRVSSTKLNLTLHVGSSATLGARNLVLTNPDGGAVTKTNFVSIVENTGGPTFSDTKFDGKIYQATWNSEDQRFVLERKPTLVSTISDTAGIRSNSIKLLLISFGTAVSSDTDIIDMSSYFTATETSTTPSGLSIITKGTLSYPFQTDLPVGLSKLVLYAQNESNQPQLFSTFIKVVSPQAVAQKLRRRLRFHFANGLRYHSRKLNQPSYAAMDYDGPTAKTVTISFFGVDGQRHTLTKTISVGYNRIKLEAAFMSRISSGNNLMVVNDGQSILDTGVMNVQE